MVTMEGEKMEVKAKLKREKGLTEVIDMGIGLNATEDMVMLAGDYIELVRLAGAMAVLYPKNILIRKLGLLKSADIVVVSGGSIFERFIRDNDIEKLDNIFIDDYILPLGFDEVEIAAPGLNPPNEFLFKCVEKITSRGVPVHFEIGFKDPKKDKAFTIKERIKVMKHALDAGVDKLKVEGRESGIDIGIFDEDGNVDKAILDDYLNQMDAMDISINDVIWEAPLKKQQAELIKVLGPQVNIGNVPWDRVILLEGFRQGVKFETLHLVKDKGMLEHSRDNLTI